MGKGRRIKGLCWNVGSQGTGRGGTWWERMFPSIFGYRPFSKGWAGWDSCFLSQSSAMFVRVERETRVLVPHCVIEQTHALRNSPKGLTARTWSSGLRSISSVVKFGLPGSQRALLGFKEVMEPGSRQALSQALSLLG